MKSIEAIQSASSNKAVRLAPILQESLDNYQNKLKAISFQFSSPLQATKPIDGKPNSSLGMAGIGLVVAGLVLASPSLLDDFLLLSFSQPDTSNWLPHVRNLRSRILKKTGILTDRLVWLDEEADKTQRKMEELIAVMWQLDDFAEIEAKGGL